MIRGNASNTPILIDCRNILDEFGEANEFEGRQSFIHADVRWRDVGNDPCFAARQTVLGLIIVSILAVIHIVL